MFYGNTPFLQANNDFEIINMGNGGNKHIHDENTKY